MSELISIHIGGAGVRTGTACWDLFCLEHGIQQDGYMHPDKKDNTDYEALSSHFSSSPDGKHNPRAVFIDLDPETIDILRCNPSRHLFHNDQLISGNVVDPTASYARSRALSDEIIDNCLQQIRKLADQCHSLEGFMVYSALGGGTGSGVGSLLVEKLSESFEKKSTMAIPIFPSEKNAASTVEPYNAILTASTLLEHVNVSVALDNDAIYDICQTNFDIMNPDISNLNHVISQYVSSMTASMRYGGTLNNTISSFEMSLIAYPRLHFMLPSYAPISKSNALNNDLSVAELTKAVFDSSSALAKCDPRMGKYLSICLMYRGDVLQGVPPLSDFSDSIQFVDWCPQILRTEMHNDKYPIAMPNSMFSNTNRSVCMISSSTAIAEVFNRIDQAAEVLLSKKEFLHWYGTEDMEAEFLNARENLSILQEEYAEVGKESVDYDEEISDPDESSDPDSDDWGFDDNYTDSEGYYS
ncbi:hypothetical protein PCE1_004437 [Barthelona sp. PCE]